MREMQLLAFEQLEPKPATIWALAAIRSEGGGEVGDIALSIKQALAEAGVRVEVAGREKHPFHLEEDGRAPRLVRADHRYHGVPRAGGRRGRMLQGAGRAAPDVADDPGAVQGLYLHAQDQRLQSLHTSLIYNNARRVEVQIKTREMHHRNEYGLAAHWAYKRGRADGEVGWLRIWSSSMPADAEELLENTKMAIYQDRIFAFTPRARCSSCPRAPRRSTLPLPCTQSGRAGGGGQDQRPPRALRTPLGNGDVVEIIKSRNSSRNCRGWALP
jgi:GTP pyrophosphokinase